LAREPNMPCWNPVLFLDAGSKLWLFYKVGPSPREWSGVYKTSEDGGKTWSPQTILPAGLLGPIKNKPVMLSNGDIICGTSIESYKAWTCWVEISSDTGRTWQKYGPIFVPDENHGIIQPTIWETAEGHVKMLVRSTHRIGFVCQAVSRDMGRTWGPATRTNLPHPGSGLDAVKLRTGQVALVYNHTKQGRSPLNVAFSRDDGRSWDAPIVLENEPGEYSYPAIIQGTDGNLHITYTWKRQRIKYAMVKP
jgi:predicted neuraminidase